MTLKEYNSLKEGDKIQIMKYFDKGRIITLQKPYEVFFKYTSGTSNKIKGFMIGNVFYGYKDCKVVKEE